MSLPFSPPDFFLGPTLAFRCRIGPWSQILSLVSACRLLEATKDLSFPTRKSLKGAESLVAPRLTEAAVSPQVVQMYKESTEVLSPPAPQGGGLRWGISSTLPQSFARVTTSMTVALHPPPLPGAYIHPASEEPAWSPAATPAANGPSNLGSRGLCPATG